MNLLIYNFAAMKNLNSFFVMTADGAKDFISLTEISEKECNLLVLSDENGGLTHFYVRKDDGFYRILSEMCKSWSVECAGCILQLNFNRHKALCYVTDDGCPVIIGSSFVNVSYADENDGLVSIRTTEEISDGSALCRSGEESNNRFWHEKWMFYYPKQDIIRGI